MIPVGFIHLLLVVVAVAVVVGASVVQRSAPVACARDVSFLLPAAVVAEAMGVFHVLLLVAITS
jgi:hypothetical protein